MATTKKTTTTTTNATDAVKPVETAVAAGKESVEAVVKASAEAATKGYEQALAMTKEQVEKMSDNVFKGYDQFSNVSKENVDAYVKSSTILAKGYEQLGKEFMAFAQGSLETNLAVAKSLLGAKSLREVIDMQTEYSRKSLDQMMAESAKLAELSVKVANEAMVPLQSQVNQNVEKMFKPAA